MGYLPIFVDMHERDCLVVGGGTIAGSRVEALLEAGATVTLIATELTPQLAERARSGAIRYCAREYVSTDMHGRFMAWVATPDAGIARAVADDAHRMGVPVNAADRPELCDFITPAVVKRGAVQIAVSTGGASPALARRLRERLETVIGREYEPLAEILGRARDWLRRHRGDQGERARILLALIDDDLAGIIRDGDWAKADRLIRTHLGVGLGELGFHEKASPEGSQVTSLAAPTLAAPNLQVPTFRQP